MSFKHSSLSRPAFHFITLIHFPTRTCMKFGLCSTRTYHANNHKPHTLPTRLFIRSIALHSVLLQSESLKSTRCPCCAACESIRAAGCHDCCILSHIQPTNNNTRQPLLRPGQINRTYPTHCQGLRSSLPPSYLRFPVHTLISTAVSLRKPTFNLEGRRHEQSVV